MDQARNPFAPGAGTRPPEFAGRDDLLQSIQTEIRRCIAGRPVRHTLMVGLRGVGKTVLLNRARQDAEGSGAAALRFEAPERRSLPALIIPELKAALLRLSRVERAKDHAQQALALLKGFASVFKAKYDDIEFAIDLSPAPGADNGDLEYDLTALLASVAKAAQRAETCVALFIDELQYVEEDQLAALITALHRAAQDDLPIILIGAGLPQLRANAAKAKSYAERLFAFTEIGPLDRVSAARALVVPAESEGVVFEPSALEAVLDAAEGYPYFIQEWGKQVWETAPRSPITRADVINATEIVLAELDKSFFLVRFDRLTPSEKRYARAMAELGPGTVHRSGDIAEELGRSVSSLAPTRANLINKGMVWSPSHGDTAFTVPLFDGFMKRIMPGDDWRKA